MRAIRFGALFIFGSLGCTVDGDLGTRDELGVAEQREPTAPASAATRRPSLRPEASTWIQPPSFSSEPCCSAEEPIGIDDPLTQGGLPAIAWDGAGWAISWATFPGRLYADKTPMLRYLDARSSTFGEPRSIEAVGIPLATAWGGDTFATFTHTGSWVLRDLAQLLVLDRSLTVRRARTFEGAPQGQTIAPFALTRGWAIVTVDGESGPGGEGTQLFVVDEQLEQVGRTVDLGRTLRADGGFVHAVAFGDRLVIVQPTEGGIRLRTFVGRSLVEAAHLEATILPGVTVDPTPIDRAGNFRASPVAAVGAARLRDSLVVAAMDHTRVRSWMFNPYTGALAADGVALADSVNYRAPGVSGDDVGGTAGVCFADGPDPRKNADALRFALVGPDGQRIGTPVTVVSGLRYVASCAVAAGGPDEYLVALWNAAKEVVRPSILVSRIRVRRGPNVIIE